MEEGFVFCYSFLKPQTLGCLQKLPFVPPSLLSILPGGGGVSVGALVLGTGGSAASALRGTQDFEYVVR